MSASAAAMIRRTAAMRYGRAWAAIGAITPALDRLFVIKKRDIQPALDYNENSMRVDARLITTITIGRSLALALHAGVRFLKISESNEKRRCNSMNHPLSDMMTNSMSKIRDMIDVNTVVGDPITTPGGVTIIPVTKVSIGYGGGGSDFAMKNMPANRDNPFGGGAGAGIKITPVAFLVIRGENVRMLPVAEPASTSVDRLIELLPDLLEKGEAYFAEKKAAKEAEKAAEEA